MIEEFITLWQSGATEIEAFTSGSTGTPKRIMLPRRLMEESALRSIRHFGLNSKSTIHLMLSADYIAGKMCIVRALMASCTLSAEAPSSEPLTGEGVPREITLLSAVGAQLSGLSKLKQAGNLPKIKHLLLGGAPLTNDMKRTSLTLAENVWESYGMTETASHIALRKVSIADAPFVPLEGIRVSTDQRGCLVVEMPTAGRIVTNDIARVLPDGNFFILGRIDNVLICGGLKAVPEHIERKLSDYMQTDRYYISSRPHPKWGEQIVLVVEIDNLKEAKTIDAKEFMLKDESLYDLSRRLLKPHERPAAAVLTPHIPLTSTGKIIRRNH